MREVPKVDTYKRREGGEQRHERGTKGGHRQDKGMEENRGMREAPKVDTDKRREREENRGMREAPKVDTDKIREWRRTEAGERHQRWTQTR